MLDFLSEARLSEKNGVSATVSTKDWLKFSCLTFLNLIPFVGSLIHLGALIYLGVSRDTAESLKCSIRASFILACIVLALYVVLFGTLYLLVR